MVFKTLLLAMATGAMAANIGRSTSSNSKSSPGKPVCPATSYVDTFDNRKVAIGLDQDNTVSCTAGGALCYDSFVYSAQDPLLEVIPSGQNVILTALGTQTQTGQPDFRVNSTYKCFDLHDLYYAVVVNSEQSVANVAESATIQLAGVSACTGKTVVQELVFNPQLLQIPFKFGFATLSSEFTCLSKVNIELIQAAVSTSSALATVMFDSIGYTAHPASYSCSSCVSA